MLFISPKIGDTASPGNDVTADTDQIAISVIRDIVPLPVLILIAVQIFHKPTQKECLVGHSLLDEKKLLLVGDFSEGFGELVGTRGAATGAVDTLKA